MSARLRESGLLDECAPQILRCAQDDSARWCHPERSEGSLADLGVITSKSKGAISEHTYSLSHPATSGAKYVIIISAPALLIPVSTSIVTRRSLIQPFWAAALIMENSPLTL